MQIKWRNVIALILSVFALTVWLRNRELINEFIGNIGRIGPGHPGDERTLGLIAFGIVAVCIVVIVRLLTQHR